MYKEVVVECQKTKIGIIGIKGIWLNNCVYKNDYMRRSADIDLIFDFKKSNKIKQVLNKLKFIQGDYVNKEIKVASRDMILYQELYTHELYQYIKIKKGYPLCLDCNFKFSWRGTKKFQFPDPNFNELIKFSTIVQGKFNLANFFSNEVNFLHICVHVFNEAKFFKFDDPDNLNDISLCKFLDIRLIVLKLNLNWDNIITLMKKWSIEEQVSYCIALIDIIFQEKFFPPFLYKEFSDSFENEVNYYFEKDGSKSKWKLSVHERIFDLDKKRNYENM